MPLLLGSPEPRQSDDLKETENKYWMDWIQGFVHTFQGDVIKLHYSLTLEWF